MRLNPLHAWHFARSLNLPKTDRVDAAMLARLGAERQPAPDPARDAAREELRELVQRRDQLTRMQTQEKNRLSACTLPRVARDIRGELANLARRLARIEAAIRDHLAGHPELARAERLLRGVPGIGPVTAATLLAHLAELGSATAAPSPRSPAWRPGHATPANPTAGASSATGGGSCAERSTWRR